MVLQLFRRKKELSFERSYAACIEEPYRLEYEARSWTEGEPDSYIEHANELELAEHGDETVVNLRSTIHEFGSDAKMAAFGMRWGYKAQLDKLEALLAG